MEILIIFIVIKILTSVFSNANKEANARRKNAFEQKVREKAKQTSFFTKDKNTGLGKNGDSLSNILREVKKTIDEFDDGGRKSDLFKKRTNNKGSLYTGSQKQGKQNPSYDKAEDFPNMKAQVLKTDAQREYELTLYGNDSENSMFDYNFKDIDNASFDSEVASNLLSEEKVAFNIRQAIIMKEILDKPKALRNN